MQRATKAKTTIIPIKTTSTFNKISVIIRSLNVYDLFLKSLFYIDGEIVIKAISQLPIVF